MEFEVFEKAVVDALAGLPIRFKEILTKEEIEIIPREKVPVSIKKQFPGGIIFGVFIGVSRKNKSTFSLQTEPTRIEIYKESFEAAFGKTMTAEMREQITKTVIHEVGHYLGFDEAEIHRLLD